MLLGQNTVAVLGAGHGGLALAGYLAQRGHRVSLWNRSAERIEAVAALGGVHLTAPGSPTEFVSLHSVTADMAEALDGADVVLVAVPAAGHADVAAECAAHLRDGQTVLLLPGRTGGSLEFRRVLRDHGCRAAVVLGEANTFPFASRATGPAEARIFGAKGEVLAAALPANRTGALIAACRPLLPMLAPTETVLHTGFGNIGAMVHPVITLLNADRITRGDSFDFYAEGVSPAVAAALAEADAERLRVAAAYGIQVESLQDWVGSAYGHHADNVRDAIGGNPSYAGIKAPTTIVHRYLLEDVPTGLIPLIELGNAAGVATPVLKSFVDRARAVLGEKQWRDARTLGALGLEGVAPEAVRDLVEHGGTPARLPRSTASTGWFQGACELALAQN